MASSADKVLPYQDLSRYAVPPALRRMQVDDAAGRSPSSIV
jgi:hypothetical protein